MLTHCTHTLTCGAFLYFIALSVADNKVAHHNEKSVENASCIEDDDEELQMSHSSTTAGKNLRGLCALSIDFHSCICLLKSVISVFTIKPRKDLQG